VHETSIAWSLFWFGDAPPKRATIARPRRNPQSSCDESTRSCRAGATCDAVRWTFAAPRWAAENPGL